MKKKKTKNNNINKCYEWNANINKKNIMFFEILKLLITNIITKINDNKHIIITKIIMKKKSFNTLWHVKNFTKHSSHMMLKMLWNNILPDMLIYLIVSGTCNLGERE